MTSTTKRQDIIDFDLELGHCFSYAIKENFISETRANELRMQLVDHYKIVDFLNECEEQDYELDSDDVNEILKLNFNYIRKQYQDDEP